MSDCCSSTTGAAPRRPPCPACGRPAEPVARRTLLHQLVRPWAQSPGAEQHYFCATGGCAVVYFDESGTTFAAEALRQPVGQKRRGAEDTLCYCFDIRYGEAAADGGACRRFVIDNTREGLCACDSRNPSGHCCLRDFPGSGEGVA